MKADLPNEINDFMFSVLYSDGTPLDIKRQAHELITYFGLTFSSDGSHKEPEVTHVPIIIPGVGQKDLSVESYQLIAGLVQNGMKINAIKELRALMGVGLREAKDAVDNELQWSRKI